MCGHDSKGLVAVGGAMIAGSGIAGIGRLRGAAAGAVPGLLAFAVGTGLLTAPWWSSSLTAADYPLVVALGTVFASIGAFAALPDRWPRLRQMAFMLFMATFGLVCAALMFTPFHPDSDGTYRIGGISGFATSDAMPWWARIVAGFFAIVCLGAAVLSAWGLARGNTDGDANDGNS